MSYPPAFASNFGVWEGEAKHFSLQGEITTSYSTRLEIGARGNKYSQRNIYTWADGRKVVKDLPGHFDESTRKLSYVSEKFTGDCIVVNEDTYLIKGESDITVGSMCEIVRMSSDRKTRCRTVQLFKDGKPWMIVNVVEQKVSNEDAFIEMDP